MLKIAICDDDLKELSNIIYIIEDYKTTYKNINEITYTTFQNPLELIISLEKGQQYDLILLDIIMPHMTGMEVAIEIRKFNQYVKIIFLTYSPEFAIESYWVNAYHYALKPILKHKLFTLLDQVISDINIQSKSSILIKSKIGVTTILLNKIEYVEIIGRTLFYHLTDESVIKANGSMNKLSESLITNLCFIKPHRSYIVNMEFIDTLSSSKIKMQSQNLIPISKVKHASIKSSYLNFSFESKNRLME